MLTAPDNFDWHDLEEKPEDVPDNYQVVMCILEHGKGCWWEFPAAYVNGEWLLTKEKVVAWRHLKPEEAEEYTVKQDGPREVVWEIEY